MKIYELYLESHSDAPDYEDSCEAEDMEEAVDIFYDELKKNGWDRETIKNNTIAVEKR